MSILRYPGGKTRAVKVLDQELPDMPDFDYVVSPFFGGGSFEFHMRDKYKKPIIANDKFEPLFNFWRHAQDANTDLVNSIRSLMPVKKETFYKCRKDLFEINNNLLRASYYYVINRCSFSGTTCSGGFSEQSASKRLTDSALERLQAFDGTNMVFTNLDFGDFLDYHTTSDEGKPLIFADPPYYLEQNSKLYGKQGDLHENFDHAKLFEYVKDCSHFIMCYNDCDYIRELYKDYNIKKVDWSYGMNKSKESSEVVITSYAAT